VVAESQVIDDPILVSPYDEPDRHFAIGPSGPTGELREGRRPSESFIPIVGTKKAPQPTRPSTST
jgi:type III restriction enzyme